MDTLDGELSAAEKAAQETLQELKSSGCHMPSAEPPSTLDEEPTSMPPSVQLELFQKMREKEGKLAAKEEERKEAEE